MIVLDASAAVEIVLQSRRGRPLARRLLVEEEADLHAPHLLGVEAVQALRRLHLAQEIGAVRLEEAMSDLLDLRIERHGHEALLRRAWELRKNMTTYDAVYVALAEALKAPLITGDERLAGAVGDLVAEVEVELV